MNRTETGDRMEAQYLAAAAQAAALGASLTQRVAIRNAAYWWAREQGTPQPAAETFADWVMSAAKDGQTFGTLAEARDAHDVAIRPATPQPEWHLCDEECGDDTHPRDGRLVPSNADADTPQPGH